MHKIRGFAGIVALFCVFSATAWAETTFYAPSPLEADLEPEYAQAILKLRAGALEDSIRALEALRTKVSGPSAGRDQRRILELEALARIEQDDAQKSRDLHEKILSLVKEQKVPELEGAPSIFAIALADLKLGKTKDAIAGFERAHQLGYNLPACHFFLGFLDHQNRDFESSARHFRQVLTAPAPAEVKGLAALYLSRIASMQGRGALALRYAQEAKGVSPDERVRIQADEKLASASQLAGFHETGGFDLRYDTNSPDLPLGPNLTDSGFANNNGPASVGLEVDLWLGYVSSTLDSWQWSIAARTDALTHAAHDAQYSDFFDQRLDFVLSHHPLDPLSFGFKLGVEGMWTTYDLAPYQLRENLGAYFRRELRPELVLLAELTIRPTHSYLELVPPTMDRSGPAYDLRVSLYSDTMRPWWNPGLSVWMEHDHTSGTEFRSSTFGLDLNDLYFASESWKGSLGASFGVSAYVDRPGKARYDPFLGLNASTQYALSWRYFLRGTASFFDDFSTVHETYRFDRFTLAVGFGANI